MSYLRESTHLPRECSMTHVTTHHTRSLWKGILWREYVMEFKGIGPQALVQAPLNTMKLSLMANPPPLHISFWLILRFGSSTNNKLQFTLATLYASKFNVGMASYTIQDIVRMQYLFRRWVVESRSSAHHRSIIGLLNRRLVFTSDK